MTFITVALTRRDEMMIVNSIVKMDVLAAFIF